MALRRMGTRSLRRPARGLALAALVALVAAGIAAAVMSQATGAPSNASLPSISGPAAVASTLAASSGGWSEATPISHQYQWSKCDSDGNACGDISSATGQTFQIPSGSAGDQPLQPPGPATGSRRRSRPSSRSPRPRCSSATAAFRLVARPRPRSLLRPDRLPTGRRPAGGGRRRFHRAIIACPAPGRRIQLAAGTHEQRRATSATALGQRAWLGSGSRPAAKVLHHDLV